MDALSYKTKFINKQAADKEWLLVDAENQVVGRLASKVAYLLRGKHKTSYTPNSDSGSNVIIINADKVRFTGKKLTDKEYIRYTGYPGGQRFATPKMLLKTKPTEILTHAIHGMLPKGILGRKLNTNVRIFTGTEHGMDAQQPKKVDLSKIK
ncbi:MAG: 50S ribosomal protein L13 [Sphingobacteriaceae bacterium]|nr:50S ribosomal protein L13 [Sphingobacteriaceae bacterium]